MDVPNLTIGRPVPAEIGSSNQANSPFCVASRVPESQKSGLNMYFVTNKWGELGNIPSLR